MDAYYVNGTYLREKEAKISVLDLGLIRGFAVFDYLRTYNKRPFHLQEHLERLVFSAHLLQLELPLPLDELKNVIHHLIDLSHHPELSIKIMVTGGISADQFTPESPSLIAFAYALTTPPPSFYQEGISVITTTLSRTLPQAKTTNYIPAILTLQKGKRKGAKEALYLNAKQEILEGTTSNIFAVKKNKLFTPYSEELLLGITRSVIFHLAKEEYEICEEPIRYEDIESFDEFFLTSSSREIVPIIAIDDKQIGSGKPGPHTIALQERFSAYAKQENHAPLMIARHQKREIPSQNSFALSMSADDLF